MLSPCRTNRVLPLVVGTLLAFAAISTITYRNIDEWELQDRISSITHPSSHQSDDGTRRPSPPTSSASPGSEDAQREFYLQHIMSPSVGVASEYYRDFGAFQWSLPVKKLWRKPLGEDFCIIDIDNRPWDQPGELWHSEPMSWDQSEQVHGLSVGVLNHWLYSKIHGYKYYFVHFDGPSDRRASWSKPAIIRQILSHHKSCIFLDSDAIIHHLDLPFEWLLNYWGLHSSTNSLALAYDPVHKKNLDKFGEIFLNTGFIVLQNNKKTFKILEEWEKCPEDGGKHPECVEFRTNDPGRPTDQGGFGTYIRYDYPAPAIKSLPCDEANGFPESLSGCSGQFVRHLWTGKDDWIKINIGRQLPGKFLELFHKQFLAEKESFFVKEVDLGTLGKRKTGRSLR